MGGRKGTGVELRHDRPSIRISFTYQGERCRETLDLAPTPANAKYAARLVAQINEKIARGVFRYGDFFPNSPRAGFAQSADRTFAAYERQYLTGIGRSAEATKAQYRNALAFWKKHLVKDEARAINSITHAEIVALVGSYPWPSWRLCNNYLIPLRGVFKLAARDLKFDDPMHGIENMKRVKVLPDPLRWEEAEAIIADMRVRYPEQVANYFDFAFHTGMRPEELIALKWDDIDWFGKTARVQRARTFGGRMKGVKTEAERDVDLSPRALAALERQKKHTFMKRGDIFENPVTGRPWHDERSQREHYWNPSLTRLGIRRRRAYATRATYATRLIMAGFKPPYVANQLGHTPMVLLTVYARWINAADNGSEAGKLAALFGTEKSALELLKK